MERSFLGEINKTQLKIIRLVVVMKHSRLYHRAAVEVNVHCQSNDMIQELPIVYP